MPTSNTRTATVQSFAARPCTVVLCRGCCCGTERKRPGTDHEGQLKLLREAADASAGQFTLLTTDCLGPCSQANVVVVRPSSAGRRRGGRAAWISDVLTVECVEVIASWAGAGGPGVVPLPRELKAQLIDPPREVWQKSSRRRKR